MAKRVNTETSLLCDLTKNDDAKCVTVESVRQISSVVESVESQLSSK